MYHTVVLTCGTSFNGNNNRFHFQRSDGEPEITLRRSGSVTAREKRTIDEWLANNRQLLNQIPVDCEPEHISAEFSAVYALHSQKKLIKRPNVVLIVTDTPGGYMVGRLLKMLFERVFQARVETKKVAMDVTSKVKLNDQLSDYLVVLNECLDKGEPSTTCFVPLGGYKLMTAYGYLVGSFRQYSTFYLQEDFMELIEVPWVPIHISWIFIKENKDFISKFRNHRLVEEKEMNDKGRLIMNQHPYFFTRDDGWTELSAFGYFLIKQAGFGYLLKTQCRIADDIAKQLQNDAVSTKFVIGEIKALAGKLKSSTGALPNELMHEREAGWHLDEGRIHFHLYKGGSHAKSGICRLTYLYNRENDTLYVHRLWLRHGDYEREAKRGIGIYDPLGVTHYKDWTKEMAD